MQLTVQQAQDQMPPCKYVPRAKKALRLAHVLAEPGYRIKHGKILSEDKFMRRLSKKTGLSASSIRRYMRTPEFNEFVISLIPSTALVHEPLVWAALLERIASGKGGEDAIKLYFQLIGKLDAKGNARESINEQNNFFIGSMEDAVKAVTESRKSSRVIEATGVVS